MKKEKKLSIFVDESGDFGTYSPHCPFYVFSLIFHDQTNSIHEQVKCVNNLLEQLGFKKGFFHAGPILRKEEDFKYFSLLDRKKSFNYMCCFIRKLPISYTTIEVDRKTVQTQLDLVLELSNKLNRFILNNISFFQKYNSLKIYYDKGQKQLAKILKASFETFFNNVEENFNASPECYKLFQAADMISTLRMVSLKYQNGKTSKTEKEFFGEEKFFRKNILNKVKNKKLT